MIEQDLNKKFISFEGIDFSGKSTQIELLKAHLESKGHTIFVLREPGGTDISERIRSILLDKKNFKLNARAEMLLFSAARVQLTEERIIPLLEKGSYVIADRFVDSTSAYQGFGRGLDSEIIEKVNGFATFDLLPSITFYLHLTAKAAAQRRLDNGMTTDRMESAGLEFYNKVCSGYQKLAEKNANRICTIDATQVKEDIHRQIISKIES